MGDEKARIIVEAVKHAAGTMEAIGAAMGGMEQQIAQVNQQQQALLLNQQQQTQHTTHTTRKPLAESKCVSNLKVLGSDKSEFKNWNEK